MLEIFCDLSHYECSFTDNIFVIIILVINYNYGGTATYNSTVFE